MNPIVSGYMSDSNEEHRFLFGLSNIQISISKKKNDPLEYGEIPKKKTILISFFFFIHRESQSNSRSCKRSNSLLHRLL